MALEEFIGPGYGPDRDAASSRWVCEARLSLMPLTNTSRRSQGRIPQTTLACMRGLRARLPGATISVEVEKPARAGLRRLAGEADYIFYSRSWAEV